MTNVTKRLPRHVARSLLEMLNQRTKHPACGDWVAVIRDAIAMASTLPGDPVVTLTSVHWHELGVLCRGNGALQWELKRAAVVGPVPPGPVTQAARSLF